MRACVLAVALTALAQPALARDHRHAPHHSVRHHHSHHHAAHADRHHHRVRHRVAPVFDEWGRRQPAGMQPSAFARTNATDAPVWQQAWQQPDWPSQDSRATARPRAPRVTVREPHGALDAMIARHAAANGLPAELVHRVVIRESRYNPRARNGSNLGLMQIKHATARGVGYTGPAAGLFDAETNLTYAVRYLAGAYRAAGGNANRAVAYYASGYRGRGGRRQPAPQQTAAWSAPSWDMRPVAMRDAGAAVYRPRGRQHRRH